MTGPLRAGLKRTGLVRTSQVGTVQVSMGKSGLVKMHSGVGPTCFSHNYPHQYLSFLVFLPWASTSKLRLFFGIEKGATNWGYVEMGVLKLTLKGVLMAFYGCFKEAYMVFKGSFKMFQGSF